MISTRPDKFTNMYDAYAVLYLMSIDTLILRGLGIKYPDNYTDYVNNDFTNIICFCNARGTLTLLVCTTKLFTAICKVNITSCTMNYY